MYMIKSYLSLRLVEKNWKMKDLVEKTELNFHTISDVYYGRRYPTEKTLQEICNVLGVRSSEIIEIFPDVTSEAASGVKEEKGKDGKQQKKLGFLGF